MNVHSMSTTGPDVPVDDPARGDIALYVSAGMDDGVEIALHASQLSDAATISILFGGEQLTLEFYDVESLERLRDLADEGARRLRAAIEANA